MLAIMPDTKDTPKMLALCLMLRSTYYASHYA